MTRKNPVIILMLCAVLMSAAVSEAFASDMDKNHVVFNGRQNAAEIRTLIAPASGIMGKVYTRNGDSINAGDKLMEYASKKVFASRDGTIAAIHCSDGDMIKDVALELAPKEKYKIYATSLKATPNKVCHYIHTGEELLIRCVSKGTHRAKGVVTQVTGNEFTVEVTAGELFVGEMVALFRGKTRFMSDHRVGKGTVVQMLNECYGIDGAIPSPDIVTDEDEDTLGTYYDSYDTEEDGDSRYDLSSAATNARSSGNNDKKDAAEKEEKAGYMRDLKVAVGEKVSRGQLLYSVSPSNETALTLPCDAVITAVKKAEGDKVEKNDILLEYVRPEDMRVTFDITDEFLTFVSPGMRVDLIYADSPYDKPCGGTVLFVTKKTADRKENNDKENKNSDVNNGIVSADDRNTGQEAGETQREKENDLKRDDLWTVEIIPDIPRLVLGMNVEVTIPGAEGT